MTDSEVTLNKIDITKGEEIINYPKTEDNITTSSYISDRSETPRTATQDKINSKICQYCGEEILAVAKRCKHCKSNLEGYRSEKIKQIAISTKRIFKSGLAIINQKYKDHGGNDRVKEVAVTSKQSVVDGFAYLKSRYEEAGGNEKVKQVALGTLRYISDSLRTIKDNYKKRKESKPITGEMIDKDGKRIW